MKAYHKIFLLLSVSVLAALLGIVSGCGGEKPEGALVSIEIDSEPVKNVYFEKEPISVTGGDIVATYENGGKKIVALKPEMCSVDLSTQGKKAVKVTFSENGVSKETEFTIYVAKDIISHAEGLQKRIDAAQSGDVYLIGAGTFEEQIVVDGKDLILIGDSPVLIGGPKKYGEMKPIPKIEGETSDFTGIVNVVNGSNVTLMRMSICGDPKKAGGERPLTHETRYAGIAVVNSSLTLEDVKIIDIHYPAKTEENLRGMQNGFGIYAAAEGGEHEIRMKKCRIEDFNKCGVLLREKGLSAEFEECVWIGFGKTDKIAQNGVQTACETKIKKCKFEGIYFEGEGTAAAAGILTVGDRPNAGDFSENEFEDVQTEVASI